MPIKPSSSKSARHSLETRKNRCRRLRLGRSCLRQAQCNPAQRLCPGI